MNYEWKCNRCDAVGEGEIQYLADARPQAEHAHDKRNPGCDGMVLIYPHGPDDDHDPVNRPRHYTSHPSGIEPLALCEHEDFLVGNVVKYVLRHRYKGDPVGDLKKARTYLNRKIELLEKEAGR